jgi:hypothetical protein
MNRLFPLPIYTFLKIAYENGGISSKGLRNVPQWLLKTILFEPLRWIELAGYNTKVNQHEIKEHPLFILGFYRNGTSFLHQCFAQDDRLGYHTNFQMIFPDIMLSSERYLSPFLEFLCRTFKFHDPIHRVPMSFRFPGEEDGTMTTALNPRGAQWGYFYPEIMIDHFKKYVLFDDIPESEKEAWVRDFLFLLKKISLANNGKRLVLKSPPNTARIRLLLSLFPNAKFVFIHRNPYDVYSSNRRFWKVTNRIYALGKRKSVDTPAIILDTYSMIMQRYLQERALVPEGQLIELRYDDFIKDPVESLRGVYESIQLNDFSYFEPHLKAFIGGQKDFVRLKHELPADEKKRVAEKLEPFFREWGYPL